MTEQGRRLAERKAERILPCVKHYYEDPMVVAEGKMQHLRDEEGREYLDFFAGILTVQVGHCNEAVNKAVVDQVGRLQHTSTVYLTEPVLDLADKMAEITPDGLEKSFFANSGTEANDTALLLAKLATGKDDIVALRHAYHGRSQVAIGVTGLSSWRLPTSAPHNTLFAQNAYCYRCPLGREYPSCEVRCARDLEDVIDTQTHGSVAALIAEPIQGVGGFITPPPEYFPMLREILDRKGGLFIADEVQTGFGRTGTHMFGIEHWGVKPDIMTFAKGMANGFPMGALIARTEIADAYSGNNVCTFGGNPVSSRAALATIAEVEDRGLPARVAELGARFSEGLEELADRFPMIGEVRGKGLMIAVELVRDPQTKEPAVAETGRIMEAAKDEGLLVGRGGGYGNVLRLTPPLIVEESDIDQALQCLRSAFDTVAG